jgi:hypothetical protein
MLWRGGRGYPTKFAQPFQNYLFSAIRTNEKRLRKRLRNRAQPSGQPFRVFRARKKGHTLTGMAMN